VDGTQAEAGSEGVGDGEVPDVAAVPYLVAPVEEGEEGGVEPPVGVGK
jgi:hypothetical protein